MKQIQLWIVVVITALGLFAFNQWRQETPSNKTNNQAELPTGYVNNATVNQYDEDGELASAILSKKITLYKQRGELDAPVMYSYHADCKKGWQTTADKGELGDFQQKKDSNILLTGNVIMERADQKTILTTSSMEFYPKRSYVVGSEAVMIKQPNGQTTATGFSIDLKNQYYRLLDDVKNYYEPTKQDPSISVLDAEQCLFKRAGQ